MLTKFLLILFLVALVCGLFEMGSFSNASAIEQASESRATKNEPISLYSISDVIWWLPEDTEAVSVVRGPFEPKAASWEPSDGMRVPELLDSLLQIVPLALLRETRNGEFYKQLVGHSVLFSVGGSRKFRSPTSLGLMLYEGCDVVVLQRSLGRAELMREMSSKAKEVHRIRGQQVTMFEEKLEQDLWRIFIAIPEPNVLLLSTNQDYLAQVLNRMHQKAQKRALPESLPEWGYVNTAAKFWAVRHYDKAEAQSDPSSPLSGRQAAANWIDTQAVGIVFDFDPHSSKVATVRYLSQSGDALKIFSDELMKASQPGQDPNPLIRLKEPGVVEMLVSLDAKEQVGMFLFVLLGLLGHAVYV